jgi:hypothetical protein
VQLWRTVTPPYFFVNRAALHDDEKIPSWIFDQLDIRDRVAVDERQVRAAPLARTFFGARMILFGT